ncbi:MAG: hypothetical protein EF813_06430 [Methanosarcinales archaeon]|nr:MAG: hypothetical protein EF813_06430 [Methanosarcinales archaeon]
MRIGITGLIVIVMMLAMIPSASAFAVNTMGTIQYEDGTTCPYGWTVCEENLNQSYPDTEPWCEPTDPNPPFWNYLVTGIAESTEEYVRVWVTSPDERWYGEKIVKLPDAWEANHPGCGFYEINIVVYEVPVETETFTKSLPLGWNLVSLPLTPIDSSTSVVLGNATIAYDAVKSYNAVTHQFEDAATMDPGVGYFVHVTTAGDWVYEGTAFTSISASLSTGLNCVGWTNATGSALPGALSSVDGSYRYVAHWDASSQSYEVYLPGVPVVFNDFTTMDRGDGYFIAATAGCTLTYP